MARGIRESRRREQNRRRVATLKWLLLVFGLLALGWLAYAAGTELARGQIGALEEQVRTLESELSATTARAEILQTERDAAVASQAALQDQVPTGRAGDLYALIADHLKNGVKEDRLLFLLRAAGDTVRCRNEPEQKRFIVQTGTTRGGNDWVAFARGGIVVRASGEPARTDDGAAHNWFDPERPVTVSFAKLNGATTTATGILPLEHSVELGGDEYRFVILPAPARGFLQVTGDRCQLPSGG
jgi:hypothetical protein